MYLASSVKSALTVLRFEPVRMLMKLIKTEHLVKLILHGVIIISQRRRSVYFRRSLQLHLSALLRCTDLAHDLPRVIGRRSDRPGTINVPPGHGDMPVLDCSRRGQIGQTWRHPASQLQPPPREDCAQSGCNIRSPRADDQRQGGSGHQHGTPMNRS